MLVQVNQPQLTEVINKILEFPTDGTVEKAILELISARQTIEDAYKGLTDALKQKMSEAGLQSVEGQIARVSISASGTKYSAKDLKEVDPSLLELKLNPTAVATYEKENGALPNNVTYATRSTACRITIKKGAND